MKLSTLLVLLPGCALAYDLLNVALYAKDPNHLYNIVRDNSDIDYGCRPTILRSRHEHKLHAFVSRGQLDRLKRSLEPGVVRVDMLENLNKRQANGAPIGRGDRFQGGQVAPRGLGSRNPGEAVDLGGIMNVDEVYSALKGLENTYGIETFTAPQRTYEGRTILGGVANKAKIGKDKQYIYLTSGIHARERGGPDSLIYFISDLLYANEHRTGLTYGNKTYSNSQVQRALEAGIVFIPLTNPDGVRHDQQNGNNWRKNRNPASSTPGNDRSVGVDLNRNFDFLWNYTRYFDPSSGVATSNDPTSDQFYGTSSFSEPETQAIAWVYTQYPKIRWFVDIHSYGGTMLYSWGDDNNQSNDPNQNLFNEAFDGRRGVLEDSVYREFIDETDSRNVALQASKTSAAIRAVGGRSYVPKQAANLYATSGSSDDYAFSRWHKDRSVNKVYGFTMEFGVQSHFYPTSEEFTHNIVDTSAGFMEFVLTASEIGLTD